MKEKVRFLGLDVHAEAIKVAIAEPDGSVRSLEMIAKRAPESIRKLVKKLGPFEQLNACYEAGPTGKRSGHSLECSSRKAGLAEKTDYGQWLWLKPRWADARPSSVLVYGRAASLVSWP